MAATGTQLDNNCMASAPTGIQGVEFFVSTIKKRINEDYLNPKERDRP